MSDSDVEAGPFAMTSVGMRMVSSFGFCGLLLYIGHEVRENLACTRRIMIPASLVAGTLGLMFVQLCQLNEQVAKTVEQDWIAGWRDAPEFLNNVVFATLFMGQSSLPGFKQAWQLAGPQLAYGQIVGWGNWVFGSIFCLALFTPVFGEHALFSTLVPASMDGGHGTSAGLAPTYEAFGFDNGRELAFTLSTFGVIFGCVFGTIVVNIGDRYAWTYKSYMVKQQGDAEQGVGPVSESEGDGEKDEPEDEEYFPTWRDKAVIPFPNRKPGSQLSVANDAVDTMALHLGFVALALLLAYFTKRLLIVLENTSEWLVENRLFSAFPLFPMCMLWGLAIQVACNKFYRVSPLDKGTMDRIGGACLDFLVLTAIATTNLSAVADSIGPLLVLLISSIIWQLTAFFFIAPLMLPNFWFERAIAELGKGFGTTSIGLLLLRMSDPNNSTPALKCFSLKQGFHEPFMCGLVLSVFMPLAVASNWIVLAISVAAILFWLAVWYFDFRKSKQGPQFARKYDPTYNRL
uniref:Sodium/glutamate symporter n=1 Tax=Mucochytrium quahogii TaxID=96639 RepID=A0A7S2RGL9_9STRA|mmetsp:Transcript_7602/g.12299  ORF Transcript_7602/g.12299 Transcript_7602/m.12299 type:complete len:517 (+) Transcript_7602:355-1905(+)|eukprot:CAMPEP_0203770774 /NCGR_PEP_ID=MMETSP0099_2-20121227/3032_1 /ASSEMBLY_ACC=CAM_ASM_000209 /TAXON_ID=96639 /ORGANISM=" , Strain NY0313808BC1" /LENGTH=516 /DNA_ID=CAMNT_0050668017 /DNA_START=271 /DNA_END=1821 /DNA_ORIENTATION=-